MKDIKRTFRKVPVIGRHVKAHVYQSELSKKLDEVSDELGIERTNSEKIEIEVGDVDWTKNQKVTIDTETFEELIQWYLEKNDI